MSGFDLAIRRLSGGAQVAIGLAGAFLGLFLVLVVLYLRSGELVFSIGTSVAIYFVVWWTAVFAVLPFRVKSQIEAGSVQAGSEPGAPAHANLLWYALVTSAVASLVSIVFLVWLAPLL
jgi:predicted secreted protein